MNILRILLAASAAMAVSGVPALAQQSDETLQAWPMGPGMMGRHMMGVPDGQGVMMGPGMMGGPMMTGDYGEYLEGRLAFLKAELAITPDQEALWSDYAEAVRSGAQAMQQAHETMMTGGASGALPDWLLRREQMMARHLTALSAERVALEPLYAAFSDEQKQAADRLLGGGMGMGMGRGMRGMGTR